MSAATEPRHGPPAAHLPDGDTCADCAHVARCVGVLGCTWPTRRECDFAPSRFRPALQNVSRRFPPRPGEARP